MTNGILVSSVYILICFITVFLVRNDNIKYENRIRNGTILGTQKKISFVTIFIVSLLFTLFNVYATWISPEYGSDRINYAIEFTGVRSTTSIALDILFFIIRNVGGTDKTAFYLTTFSCVFLTLLAYRISRRTNYKVYMLLLTSEWILFTITAIKQAYACAFACLFFVYVIEDVSKRGTVKSAICALIASLFHFSGLILFPIFILVRTRNISKRKVFTLSAIIFFVVFGMKPILMMLQPTIRIFMPALANKINTHFVFGYGNDEASSMAFIKYLPIYYIAVLGIIKRRKLGKKIENYNKYLLISILGASLVAYTMFSYWFSRFTGIFSFVIYIFYVMINDKTVDKTNKIVNNMIIYGAGFTVLIRKIILIFINWGSF